MSGRNDAVTHGVKDEVSLRFEPELLHEVRTMRFGGAAADKKRGGDFAAGFAFSGKFQHDEFALGQLLALHSWEKTFQRRRHRFLPEGFAQILSAPSGGADRSD